MSTISARRLSLWACSFLVLAASLSSSGCLAAAVTAGVVGAGAAGYTYYQAAVPRDYPATMDSTWVVTQQALTELGMTIETAQRDNDTASIQSRTGDGTKVEITLEPRTARIPADGQWTHVTVRVGLIGDAKVADRIFNQMDTRLAPQPPPPGRLVPVPQDHPGPQAVQGAPLPLAPQ
jgi:hypothetical protein